MKEKKMRPAVWIKKRGRKPAALVLAVFFAVQAAGEPAFGIAVTGRKLWGETEHEEQADGKNGTQTGQNGERIFPGHPPSLTANSAALIDGETGRLLFGKNEENLLPMASTTKLMTCILAMEHGSLDEVVTVSEYAASMPDVQLNIWAGETYRLEDLLYSLMLESHNDSAVAVAEHVGGSVEGFAEMMNQKARDIGCVQTFFITPNGLDAADEETGRVHSTTAEELALILRYCLCLSPKKEEFLTITRAPSWTFSDTNQTRSFSCINHNALLTSMEGALTGKTGYTNDAGYCYAGAVRKGDKLFIAALLGCGWPPHKNEKWKDMGKLIRYGDETFQKMEIGKEELSFEPVPVLGGILESVHLFAEKGEDGISLLMSGEEPVTIRTRVPKTLSAPFAEGTVVGQADYFVGETIVESIPIKTKEGTGLWDLEFCAGQIWDHFFLDGEDCKNFDRF